MAHQRGIDGGSVALSIGHSFEVHCRSYQWASAAGAAAAFERANAALMVACAPHRPILRFGQGGVTSEVHLLEGTKLRAAL